MFVYNEEIRQDDWAGILLNSLQIRQDEGTGIGISADESIPMIFVRFILFFSKILRVPFPTKH